MGHVEYSQNATKQFFLPENMVKSRALLNKAISIQEEKVSLNCVLKQI